MVMKKIICLLIALTLSLTVSPVLASEEEPSLSPLLQEAADNGDAEAQNKSGTSVMSYEEFKSLTDEQQIEVFSRMTGPQIYALVASSDESWPVTDYDLISPNNAKETIVLFNNNGDLHFNLAWPHYGGFLPESIASMDELTGKLDVSRDGGDGGHSMSYGKNEDGSYPNDSQRSVPKTSATVRTGILDVDQYNKVAETVTNGESEEERITTLTDMGYDNDTMASQHRGSSTI